MRINMTKKGVSALVAVVMCLSAFLGIGSTTVFAEEEITDKVVMIACPRDGDSNLDGNLGHGNTDEYAFEFTKDGLIINASATNEETPVPDISQTADNSDSDNSNYGFWIGLGAIALGGLIAMAIIVVKRKKDDEE